MPGGSTNAKQCSMDCSKNRTHRTPDKSFGAKCSGQRFGVIFLPQCPLHKKEVIMLNLNVPVSKRLDDNVVIAMALQCLYASMGEGVSIPEMARFISVQSAKPCSTYRLEKIVHKLVKDKHIDVDVKVSTGGRVTRKYRIMTVGLLMLCAYTHFLPKVTRNETIDDLLAIFKVASEKLLEVNSMGGKS